MPIVQDPHLLLGVATLSLSLLSWLVVDALETSNKPRWWAKFSVLPFIGGAGVLASLWVFEVHALVAFACSAAIFIGSVYLMHGVLENRHRWERSWPVS